MVDINFMREFKYTVVNDILVTYESKMFGFSWKPVEQTDLRQVKHIDYYISPFSRKHTVRMSLWTEDPKLELSPNLLDRVPTNHEAKNLAFVRTPDFINTFAHDHFLKFFNPLITAGKVTTNLDINVFRPLDLTALAFPNHRTANNQGLNRN